MDAAAINAKAGLSQVETANRNHDRGFNPFRRSPKNGDEERNPDDTVQPPEAGCNWTAPFESFKTGMTQIADEVCVMRRKMTLVLSWGSKLPTK